MKDRHIAYLAKKALRTLEDVYIKKYWRYTVAEWGEQLRDLRKMQFIERKVYKYENLESYSEKEFREDLDGIV